MSKARLAEYEADVERLEKQYQELHYMTERLKAARDFESLKRRKRILFAAIMIIVLIIASGIFFKVVR